MCGMLQSIYSYTEHIEKGVVSTRVFIVYWLHVHGVLVAL